MSALPRHFCPGCGTPLEAFARYPWYFCTACRNAAVDGAGRGLDFGNEGVSGGFMFRYAGAGDDGWIPARGVIALIAGRPARITEARFGGVVAEPIADGPGMHEDKVFDLRRGERIVAPPARAQGSGPARRPFQSP